MKLLYKLVFFQIDLLGLKIYTKHNPVE